MESSTSTNGQNSGKVKDNTRLLGLASVAGDTLDVVAASQRQKIARESAAYRLKAARFNAEGYDIQAMQTAELGGLQGAQAEGQAAQIAGQQGLALAAQGVDIGGMDAARLRLGTTTLGRIDADTLKHNALREALGLQARGAAELAQGYMDAAAIKAEARPSLLKAGLGLTKSLLQMR